MARPFTPPAKWKGEQHFHGCTQCRARYLDACVDLKVDGTCNPCRSGITSNRQTAWAPRPCCLGNARLCEKYDRERHKLAGPGPWFRCTACARTFPAQPEQVRT